MSLIDLPTNNFHKSRKGQKNGNTGGIFILCVLVSMENHKLQFASNSCPERARHR